MQANASETPWIFRILKVFILYEIATIRDQGHYTNSALKYFVNEVFLLTFISSCLHSFYVSFQDLYYKFWKSLKVVAFENKNLRSLKYLNLRTCPWKCWNLKRKIRGFESTYICKLVFRNARFSKCVLFGSFHVEQLETEREFMLCDSSNTVCCS